MTTAHYLLGDTREVTATLPDGSIDLVTCSPPFLALRSYLPADHPDKGKEIGSEPDPATFLGVLLELTAEWRRVLAPHGSIAIELGDTYSGSGGAGGDYNEGGLREGQAKFSGSAAKAARNGLANYADQRGNPDGMRDTTFSGANTRSGGGPGWPLAKSLTMIPELYRVALAYGIHPLTGEPSPAGRWRVRNVVRWCRPNPTVGALGDKFRPATSDIVVATLATDRWFDGDAVRVPSVIPDGPGRGRGPKWASGDSPRPTLPVVPSDGTRPLYDWWEVPPGGYPGSHYAVFPPAIVKPLIDSMCPREVCTACGVPRRRLVETVNAVGHAAMRKSHYMGADPRDDRRDPALDINKVAPDHADRRTLGWSACGCEAPFRPGIVLDPFAGSGTTLMVASGLARTSIGIDIDERNLDLARERVGMFLTTDHPFTTTTEEISR